MALDWERVLEELAFCGPQGIDQDAFFARLAKAFPAVPFDPVTRPLIWSRVCRQPQVQFLVPLIGFSIYKAVE